MTNFVEWSDGLSVGLEPIDDDHKVLISMINRMHSIIANEDEDFEVHLLLAKLAKYTILHFRREEIAMQTSNYPDYDTHVELHHKLENKVYDLLKYKNRKIGSDEADELLHFLSDWLIDHIATIDQKYADYAADHKDAIVEALKDSDALESLEL